MAVEAVKLAPDVVMHVGELPITNTMLGGILSSLLLILFALLMRKGAGVKPGRLQIMFEMIYLYFKERADIAFGSEERARRYVPLMVTVFFFLFFANQFVLLPLVESVVVRGADGSVNLLATPTSHYALPIALALFMILMAHFIAFFRHPLRHIGNFIKVKQFFQMKSIKDLPMALLDFFLGFLDIIGEFAKLASLSTRLFGNVFAGGLIVMIISSLSTYTQFVAPLPFVVLGILSGTVQAFVFAMLSILFVSSTITAVDDPQEA